MLFLIYANFSNEEENGRGDDNKAVKILVSNQERTDGEAKKYTIARSIYTL